MSEISGVSPENQKRILVADVNKEASALLARYLAEMGFDVTIAADGERALQEAKSNRYDLVILDILIPLLDGLKVTSALKSDPKTAHTPILIASVFNAPRRVHSSGADGFLLKPLTKGSLANAVESLLATEEDREG